MIPKRKKKSPRSLKKKAWALCSEWIRRKDSDNNGNAKCVTCGHVDHWKYQQAGHFVPGRTNAILYDERNIHVQCVSCNIWKHGNLIHYTIFMQEKYGQEVIDELLRNKHKTVKMGVSDYESLISGLQDKLEQLDRKKAA